MNPGKGHDSSEITKKDKFPSPYCGRIYRGMNAATEIVSMGMEMMYKNPLGFYTQDPEYFRFIYDVMSGAFL